MMLCVFVQTILLALSRVIEANGSLSQWLSPSEKRLVVVDFFATWYIGSFVA